MIDLEHDKLLSLKDAAALIPGQNVKSLRRWSVKGSGGTILETVFIGGRRYTTRAFLEQFIEQCTAKKKGPMDVISKSRRKCTVSKETRKGLIALGFKL